MVEGCEFVGSCEDVDGRFVLLSCVREIRRDMEWGGENTLGTKTNLPSSKAANKSARSGKIF